MPEEEFPENIVELIDEILKESNLFEEHEKGISEWLRERDEKKAHSIWENLPGRKLAKIVADYFRDRLPEENLVSRIKEDLVVSSFRAEEIARKLKMAYLSFKKTFFQEETSKESEQTRKTFRDIYREPVE